MPKYIWSYENNGSVTLIGCSHLIKGELKNCHLLYSTMNVIGITICIKLLQACEIETTQEKGDQSAITKRYKSCQKI